VVAGGLWEGVAGMRVVGRWLGDLGTARLGGLRLAASQRLGRNQRPLGHTQAHTAVFSDPCLG